MCSVRRSILKDKTSRNLFFFLCLNLSFAFVELLYGIWSNRYRGGAGRERLSARRKRRLPPRTLPRLPVGGAGPWPSGRALGLPESFPRPLSRSPLWAGVCPEPVSRRLGSGLRGKPALERELQEPGLVMTVLGLLLAIDILCLGMWLHVELVSGCQQAALQQASLSLSEKQNS